MSVPDTRLEAYPIPDGRVEFDGKTWMYDTGGALVPVEAIKPQHLLEDERTRIIMRFAVDLSQRIARFKNYTITELGMFDELLAQEYGVVKLGNRPARDGKRAGKGNRTYKTLDGLLEVKVRVQERIEFGPELQVAKMLVDECLIEWSADARPELRAIITDAFNVDQEGRISTSAIYRLLRRSDADPR